MEYPCEVIERQAQPVLSIRTRVAVQNLPETVGKGYMAIAQHLESLGKAPQGFSPASPAGESPLKYGTSLPMIGKSHFTLTY
jgi:hypothetical protein